MSRMTMVKFFHTSRYVTRNVNVEHWICHNSVSQVHAKIRTLQVNPARILQPPTSGVTRPLVTTGGMLFPRPWRKASGSWRQSYSRPPAWAYVTLWSENLQMAWLSSQG